MSIVRGKRPESGWYALDRRISEDGRLSWAARGMLIFLLGKPDDWCVSVEHLRKQTSCARIRTGRDGVYALLDELRTLGYVRTIRQRKADGTLGPLQYVVREAPLPAEPEVAGPDMAEPDTAGTTLDKTERAVKTEKAPSTDSNEKSEGVVALTRTADLDAVIEIPEWLDGTAVTAFAEHRHALGRPLTAAGWQEISRLLEDFEAQGVDPNESLRTTIAAGYALPVDPRRGREAIISRRRERQQCDEGDAVAWHDRNLPSSCSDQGGAWTPH